MDEVVRTALTTVISALLSTGIASLVLRFSVEGALKEARERKEQEVHRRQERYKIEDEYTHDVGRCIFWLWHGAKAFEAENGKRYWNGELEQAVERMNRTEQRRKELDQQQLAEVNEPK